MCIYVPKPKATYSSQSVAEQAKGPEISESVMDLEPIREIHFEVVRLESIEVLKNVVIGLRGGSLSLSLFGSVHWVKVCEWFLNWV